jgi:uncharacterized protein (TIGR00375 family)
MEGALMSFIADLHIHSLYSRATSKASNLFGLAAWAAVKGIGVVGTGDFTHPAWFAHLHEWLLPAEPGLFRLKPDCNCDWSQLLPPGLQPALDPTSIRFLLSAEISSIYKRGGQVRKVHNLLYAPDFDAVRRINSTLATLGNISSDGRPILGLDSRDLLEILLEKAVDGFLVPAHIWTPWFSLFGSKSGFDRIEDCFVDLSHHIFALETGLSSDPEMNRLISALDRFTLISNSDCHSPAKLGREANLFATEKSFFGIRDALRQPRNDRGEQVFAATVEFYPEEGKYHCDGHRKCNVCLEPLETRKVGGLCPNCGKPLTIGVLHRVMELADRSEPGYPPGSPAVHSLIPLQEIVAELFDCGPATKKAVEGYVRLINLFGSEFGLLLDAPLDEINAKAGGLLVEAIKRVRTNQVIRRAGYDGEFGVIRVFDEGERATLCGQGTLFGLSRSRSRKKSQKAIPHKLAEHAPVTESTPEKVLNGEQQRAVASEAGLIVVQAGPGTGKTHTLVSRVQRVAGSTSTPCTVITFTNKAADEVRYRLQSVIQEGKTVTVATFHGYCLNHLRRLHPGLRVIGPEERLLLVAELFPGWGRKEQAAFNETLSGYGRSGALPESQPLHRYLRTLAEQGLIDLDTLVPEVLALLREPGGTAEAIRKDTGHLFVDEFQDVNQAQYQLVALLAERTSVFAIGDPDQAIYGFRGSDPGWFHRFITDFQAECHQLVRNYRSGETIVRAAEALISHNFHPGSPTPMQAMARESGRIHLMHCGGPELEAVAIADQIEVQLGGTSHRALERFDATGQPLVSLRDIGILYRTSRQSEAISRVLGQRGIPFQLVDLESYYIKGQCRLLYAWVLVLAGLASPTQLLWLFTGEEQLGRHVPETVFAALQPTFREHDSAQATRLVLQGLAGTGSISLLTFYERLLEGVGQLPISELLHLVIEYYQLDMKEGDLCRFRELALGFEQSIPALAKHLLHFSDSVLYDNRAEAVTLSTLHAAKGLEFPIVFIAGVEEDLLPLAPRQSLSLEQVQAHLQEERRLFFVGITRAISMLYLSWCRKRSLYGGPAQPRQPSSFIEELPAELLTPPSPVRPTTTRRTTYRQLSLFP